MCLAHNLSLTALLRAQLMDLPHTSTQRYTRAAYQPGVCLKIIHTTGLQEFSIGHGIIPINILHIVLFSFSVSPHMLHCNMADSPEVAL